MELGYLPAGVRGDGVDLSAGMLRRARRRRAEYGMRNLGLRVMDARALEYPDESFDAVYLPLILTVVEDGARGASRGRKGHGTRGPARDRRQVLAGRPAPAGRRPRRQLGARTLRHALRPPTLGNTSRSTLPGDQKPRKGRTQRLLPPGNAPQAGKSYCLTQPAGRTCTGFSRGGGLRLHLTPYALRLADLRMPGAKDPLSCWRPGKFRWL